jgi:hypothetical protein
MRRRRYHAALTKAEGLEARLQHLEGAAAQPELGQAQQAQQAQLQQALRGAAEARRAAEQRAEEAEQQLEQLVQQLSQGEQRRGGGGGGWVFGSLFENIGKALGGGRKGGGGEEAAVRQPLPLPQPQQDSPRRAAGRELEAALQIAAAAAPTAASVRPRLLYCYDAAPIIGFGPTEQLQALEGLAKAVEGFAEGCLQRISGNADAAMHLVRALDEWLLRLLRPAGASAAAGVPTTADACSLLQQLHERRLLVTALAHMTLRSMQSELWLHPLSLAGLGSAAEEVLVSGGEEEQEAALQLQALSFQRLYRQFMAGQGLRGQGQGGAITLPLTTGCAADLDRALVCNAADLCQRLGLGLVDDAAVQVVRQGYALGLLMGAAHPELRPFVSVSDSQLEAGRHAVVREVQGGGGGSNEFGSGDGGGQVVLLSRRPGWVFRGRQQVHIKEEVVAVQA